MTDGGFHGSRAERWFCCIPERDWGIWRASSLRVMWTEEMKRTCAFNAQSDKPSWFGGLVLRTRRLAVILWYEKAFQVVQARTTLGTTQRRWKRYFESHTLLRYAKERFG